MTKIYDILIVGAGPSGLSTALHLNRFSPELNISILEKSRHPREKLCAGGILAEGETILAKLDLNLLEVPHVDVEKASFNYEGRGLLARFLNKKPIFRTVRRNEFDAWLAKKCRERGIKIIEEITVKKVEAFAEYALVSTDQGEFKAKIVVGADGSNSIVRRMVMQNPRPHVGRALEVITPALTQPSSSGGGQKASFDFLSIPKGISGYVWDFPTQINGEAMRCWGIYDSNAIKRKERAPLRQVLADEMAAQGYDLNDYELKGHPIRWYEPANTPAVSRVILVGDAMGAGMLLGEGISPALGHGRVAAKEIARAFEKNDFSFRGYKGKFLRSGLGGTLWRRTFIAKLFYNLNAKWFQHLLWRWFNWIPGLVGLLFVVGWEKKKK